LSERHLPVAGFHQGLARFVRRECAVVFCYGWPWQKGSSEILTTAETADIGQDHALQKGMVMKTTKKTTPTTTTKDPTPGDVVKALLADGSIKRVKLMSYCMYGYFGIPEGSTVPRIITRWMIEQAR
jgi:hypothetical protein